MPRPRLLFVTPHFPDPEGNGSSRRANSTLAALSLTHEVTLLHIAPAPDYPLAPPPDLTLSYARANGTLRRLRRRLARRHPALFAALLGPPDWANHTAARLRHAAALATHAAPFDTIHAFRLFVAPHALAIAHHLRQRPALHLDLDDIESLTRARIATVLENMGDRPAARLELANAGAYARMERRLLPRFDRLYVASAYDATRLRHPFLRVLPNVVAIPAAPLPPPPPKPLRLLFIGALGYAPNQDALVWFLNAILPALRTGTPCEFLVAGRHAPDSLRNLLASTPGVTHLGPVEHAASAYRDAHLVIAPLRAGGGTRLKILESFALGRPVVATALAAEGLDIADGQHALLADSAADFAAACARLAANPALRATLAARARNWVATHHSPAALSAPLG